MGNGSNDITNENGAVTGRKDFGPFGDGTVTAQRTTDLGYTPPNIRQDFTGYQKDEESQLEYAQARYFNPTHGRFTSVDPLTASATIRNPQTFNRYSYGLNSPYKFTDPLGLTSVLNQRSDDYIGGPGFYGCSAEFSTCEDSDMWSEPLPAPDSYTYEEAKRGQHEGSVSDSHQKAPPPLLANHKTDTQNWDVIVLIPGSVFHTVEVIPGELIPQDVPTNQVATDPFILSKWSIHLEMRIEGVAGETQTDYEFEVLHNELTPDKYAGGRQAAPADGEALVGTFTVDRRRFGVETGGSHPQPTADGWSRSGTIKIYRSGGSMAAVGFELTYTGSTGAVGITPSRTSLNWTRPSN